MGWISREPSLLTRWFIEFCGSGSNCAAASPALDVGAALGVAALAALRGGAWVVANDLDPEHLREIEQHAGPAERARLTLRPGRFPSELHFEEGSLGAVHASNVFHFLTGNQLAQGMQAIARWLRPGGRLFVQAASPYQAPFAAFLPEYARRLQQGVKWPGWIPKVSTYSSHRQLSQMPRSIHLLDDLILAKLAEQAGLQVEQALLYRRHDLPAGLHLDGRETAALVATRVAV
jgi:SAM-dependent methyltransferase